MDNQVNDYQGNLFHPKKSQEILVKSGWRRFRVQKRGMFKIVLWVDPLHGEIVGQGDAILIQKMRNADTIPIKKID